MAPLMKHAHKKIREILNVVNYKVLLHISHSACLTIFIIIERKS